MLLALYAGAVLARGHLTATSQFLLGGECVRGEGIPRSLARTSVTWIVRETNRAELWRYRVVEALRYDIRICVRELGHVYGWLVMGRIPGCSA